MLHRKDKRSPIRDADVQGTPAVPRRGGHQTKNGGLFRSIQNDSPVHAGAYSCCGAALAR